VLVLLHWCCCWCCHDVAWFLPQLGVAEVWWWLWQQHGCHGMDVVFVATAWL